MKRYHRILAGGFCSALAIAIASPAQAQAGGCSREQLEKMAGDWVRALEAGSPFEMQLGEWVDYREDFHLGSMSAIFTKPREVDWHLQLLDTTQCQVFVESVMTDPEHPYVMATQINSGWGGGVGTINNIVTDEGDWLFDAAYTYKYASQEDWSVIPEERRNTREEIIAAADAYLDLFKDKSVEVPWGTPCARLEGSIYTGRNRPDDSCNVGVPDGVDLVNRQYVVDEAIGAVDVFLEFGTNERPDSHLFRVEDGKIRYVHTVTNCGEQDNCGFPPFDQMLADNPDMHPDL